MKINFSQTFTYFTYFTFIHFPSSLNVYAFSIHRSEHYGQAGHSDLGLKWWMSTVHTLVPDTSSNFTSYFVVLEFSRTFWTKASLGGVNLCLFPECCSVYVGPTFLYLHTVVCTAAHGTFSCFGNYS